MDNLVFLPSHTPRPVPAPQHRARFSFLPPRASPSMFIRGSKTPPSIRVHPWFQTRIHQRSGSGGTSPSQSAPSLKTNPRFVSFVYFVVQKRPVHPCLSLVCAQTHAEHLVAHNQHPRPSVLIRGSKHESTSAAARVEPRPPQKTRPSPLAPRSRSLFPIFPKNLPPPN
jgi:hypothetical protein